MIILTDILVFKLYFIVLGKSTSVERFQKILDKTTHRNFATSANDYCIVA